MGESKLSPRRIEAAEKARRALEMRKAGASFATIAQQLGYNSVPAAFKAVNSLLKRTLQQPADELRRLEVERLDALTLAISAQARRGNLGAIDRLLKIAERRAKLLGLDAPTKQEVTGKDGGPILVSAEWVQIRSILLRTLLPYPEARVAVAAALLEAEHAPPGK